MGFLLLLTVVDGEASKSEICLCVFEPYSSR